MIFAVFCFTKIEAKEIKFKTVSGGILYSCGVEKQINYIITNEKDWQNLWNKTFPHDKEKPRLPKINFSKETVIAVYMGRCGSGGYGIGIYKIIETKNIEIFVEIYFPAEGSMVSQAITYPYDIIKIPKKDKKIQFKYITEKY